MGCVWEVENDGILTSGIVGRVGLRLQPTARLELPDMRMQWD